MELAGAATGSATAASTTRCGGAEAALKLGALARFSASSVASEGSTPSSTLISSSAVVYSIDWGSTLNNKRVKPSVQTSGGDAALLLRVVQVGGDRWIVAIRACSWMGTTTGTLAWTRVLRFFLESQGTLSLGQHAFARRHLPGSCRCQRRPGFRCTDSTSLRHAIPKQARKM